MNIEDKVFTLDDNREYLVLFQINYENDVYVCLSAKDNEEDMMFKKFIINSDGSMTFDAIDTTLFEEKLFPLFLKKLTD